MTTPMTPAPLPKLEIVPVTTYDWDELTLPETLVRHVMDPDPILSLFPDVYTRHRVHLHPRFSGAYFSADIVKGGRPTRLLCWDGPRGMNQLNIARAAMRPFFGGIHSKIRYRTHIELSLQRLLDEPGVTEALRVHYPEDLTFRFKALVRDWAYAAIINCDIVGDRVFMWHPHKRPPAEYQKALHDHQLETA